MEIRDRLLGSFLGLAVGDAIGTTVEFRMRDTFEPVTDMIGKGPFNLPAGYWTDDTSMALCLAESLIHYPLLDKADLLSRFSRWFRNGENSSTGRCFDIGTTTRTAILNFEKTGSTINSTYFLDAGNGSIMRLSPVILKYFTHRATAIDIAKLQSETTHGSQECIDSCELMTYILHNALYATNKEEVLQIESRDYEWDQFVDRILSALTMERDEIKSSGYVIDTLQAAIWCFNQTASFEAAVLLATNLGDDADTVAAVTGQIAGAYYGMSGIPDRWLNTLYDTERFIELGNRLIDE